MSFAWPPNQRTRRASIDGTGATVLLQSKPAWVGSVVRNGPGDYTLALTAAASLDGAGASYSLVPSGIALVSGLLTPTPDSIQALFTADDGTPTDATFFITLVQDN